MVRACSHSLPKSAGHSTHARANFGERDYCRLSSITISRISGSATRLEFRRKRPDESHASNVYELADLLKTDFRFAARNDRSDWFAGWRSAHLPTLASHLISNAELRKQRGG